MIDSITLEEIEEMWTKDAKIDITEPSLEMARISNLHAKYSKFLNHHTMMVKKLMAKYKKLEQLKTDYYSGDLNNPEDLAEHNLEPFSKVVRKPELPKYIARDQDIIDMSLKIDEHLQIAKFVESIVKEINNRTFQMNGIIKWQTFERGLS